MPISAATCLAVVLSLSLASGHSIQKPMQQQPSNFIQTSIFHHQSALLASVDEPVQHVYDDFQDDIPFQGIAYFAHLNNTNCFSASTDGTFDIVIVGAPFDLGVTYRPGARFGPAATRMGSRRLSPSMGYRYTISLRLRRSASELITRQHGSWCQPVSRLGQGGGLWRYQQYTLRQTSSHSRASERLGGHRRKNGSQYRQRQRSSNHRHWRRPHNQSSSNPLLIQDLGSRCCSALRLTSGFMGSQATRWRAD